MSDDLTTNKSDLPLLRGFHNSESNEFHMKQTRVRFAVFGAALVLLALTPTAARASSLTFLLNCSVTSATTCGSPTGSFGSVTLSENANALWLDLTVTLNLGDPTKNFLSRLFLNYSPAIGAGYNFTTTDSETAVSTGTNTQVAASGYTVAFDIKFTNNDTVPVNPWTTVLKLQKASNPDIDLNLSDFDVKDANGLLFALVNHSGAGSQIGSTSDVLVTTTAVAAVPEPATLVLCGIGAMLAASRLRRRQ